MAMPLGGCSSSAATTSSSLRAASARTASSHVIGSYTHVPAPNSGGDLPPGSGPVMPTTTIYYDFWLPTGQHYESNAAGDLNYEQPSP